MRERYTIPAIDFLPNTFTQIAALDSDALILDIAVAQQAGRLWKQLHAEARTGGIPVLIDSSAPQLGGAGAIPGGTDGNHRNLALAG